MAIELCSEKSSPMAIITNTINSGNNSNNTTPRISFSYDFLQSDVVPIEQRPLRSPSSGLNSSADFDFCVTKISGSDDHDDVISSSADELFSDGKILPTDIKKKPPNPPTATAKHFLAPQETPQRPDRGPITAENSPKGSKKEGGGESRSFWRFKRSSSCGSGGYGRTLCPLPLLSRSNSTGSADETKPINIKSSAGNSNPRAQSSNYNGGVNSYYQKPPLKNGKSSLGAYGNGVSINPVLNVPPANLFAMGSIFSNGKNKSKRK